MSKLKRNLSSSHVVSMGLAWMSPIIFFTSLGVCSMKVQAIRFLNFGALTAFLFVNISVVYHFIIRSKQYKLKDFVLRLIFPSIGALFVLYLITLLDSASFLLGSGWLIIGLVYYFIRKKKNQIEVTDLDSKENQELLRA
jgi:amino acid transporter